MYFCLTPLALLARFTFFYFFFFIPPSPLRGGLTATGAEAALCDAGQRPFFLFLLQQDGWSGLQTALPR